MNNEILSIYRNSSGKVIGEFRGGDAPHISQNGWKDTLNDIRYASAKYIRIDKNVAYFGYEGITLKLNNFMDLLQDEELVRYLSPSILKTLHRRLLVLERTVAKRLETEGIKVSGVSSRENIRSNTAVNNIQAQSSRGNEQLRQSNKHRKLQCDRKNKHISLKTKVVAGALVLTVASAGVAFAITANSQKNEVEPIPVTVTTRKVPAEGMLAVNHLSLDDYLPEELALKPELTLNIDDFDQTRLEKVLPYEDRSDSLEVSNVVDNYGKLIQTYAEKCGIDPKIMCAIAAQESAGQHEYGLTHGSKGGLFQIEMSNWRNKTISYYDIKEQKEKEILVDDASIKDSEKCIEIACALMQDALNRYRSIPLAIQEYNMGYYNLKPVLQAASQDLGVTTFELYNDETCPWKNYISFATDGDKGYLDKVLSFAGFGYDNQEFTCKLINGQTIACSAEGMFENIEKVEETSKTK